jgi:hypothetical protein
VLDNDDSPFQDDDALWVVFLVDVIVYGLVILSGLIGKSIYTTCLPLSNHFVAKLADTAGIVSMPSGRRAGKNASIVSVQYRASNYNADMCRMDDVIAILTTGTIGGLVGACSKTPGSLRCGNITLIVGAVLALLLQVALMILDGVQGVEAVYWNDWATIVMFVFALLSVGFSIPACC